MTYNLPFTQGQKLLEIGGGNVPIIRPNLDIRKEPNVDIVADISKPLPIKDNELDGVFSKFAIEHISWKQIRAFIKEVYRILKPGGQAVFITANLLEQARILTEVPNFEDNWVCMVFGENDYPENSHRAGFSPEFAGRLFKETGFERVIVAPWPDWRGDMIIEAKKAKLEPEKIFDKKYFNGGNEAGGYKGHYRDYVQNRIVFNKIMKDKPESVLELGCSRGYVLKMFEDAKVKAFGMDISAHAFRTRVSNSVIQANIFEKWSLPDKSIDYCYSVNLFEHIPEEHMPHIVSEIKRVCKRGLHGIDFGEQDNGFDKSYYNFKNKEWWEAQLPKGQKVVSSYVLKSLEPNNLIYDYISQGDGKVKLNIGSYISMFHDGWINIDALDINEYAANEKYKFYQKNIKEGLPFDNDTVDLIYNSHLLQQLTYDETKAFFGECLRVMKKGAAMRLAIADVKSLIEKYSEERLEIYDEINDGAEKLKFGSGKLWEILFAGNKAIYDFEAIKVLASGFEKIEQKQFRMGHEQILKETLESLPELNLFVELVK